MKTKLALILLPATLALGACMQTQADRTMVGATATGAAEYLHGSKTEAAAGRCQTQAQAATRPLHRQEW